jgi:hypothetical protein
MPNPDHERRYLAEKAKSLIQAVQSPMSTAYDREIAQRTQKIIERSLALLEETDHKVLPPSQGRSDRL